ncbi:hypothetical protein BsWGS_10911 [Bradybaena similaris]
MYQTRDGRVRSWESPNTRVDKLVPQFISPGTEFIFYPRRSPVSVKCNTSHVVYPHFCLDHCLHYTGEMFVHRLASEGERSHQQPTNCLYYCMHRCLVNTLSSSSVLSQQT